MVASFCKDKIVYLKNIYTIGYIKWLALIQKWDGKRISESYVSTD